MESRTVRKWIINLSASVGLITYAVGAGLPAESLWFDPGIPTFLSTPQGEDPVLVYDREIKREQLIAYYGVIRDAATGETVCESRAGPFTYEKNHGPIIGKTLTWFFPNDPRCQNLPVGDYYGSVTWVVDQPLAPFLPNMLSGFGWLLPSKSVSRSIPVFAITGEV